MIGKRYLSAGVAALLLAALAATSAGQAVAQVAGEPSPKFKRLDTNRDGFISRDEAAKLKEFDRAFNEADENRDGRLSPEEFVKADSINERIRAGQYLDDSMITAKVKAALVKDMQLKGLSVSVETHKGTVLLSGFVNDRAQVQRALEIAAGIEGVTRVRNSLAVKG